MVTAIMESKPNNVEAWYNIISRTPIPEKENTESTEDNKKAIM
jgi:hypothetical protein